MAKSSKQADAQPAPLGPIPDDIARLSYEDAISELESIIDRIESGEIGLEESVKQYERGVILRRHCESILSRAEQRITELTPEPPSGG